MSDKLPRITAKELVKFVESRGFTLVRQSGSHMIYKNEDGLRTTIPFHAGKIIHPKLLKSILSDLDVKAEDFKDLYQG